MKGYSEQRNVQTQTVYDVTSGRFQQRVVPHGFATAAQTRHQVSEGAEIIELMHHESKRDDNRLSHKIRKTTVPRVNIKRTG